MRKTVLLLLFSLFLALGLSASITKDEYLAQSSREWFLTGKSSYMIEGKLVSEETAVYNELEDASYVAKNNGNDVILKGTAGELWVSKLSKVLSTYSREDGTALKAEDFIPDEFVTLRTQAKPGTNFAFFVPVSVVVEVETAWGDVLTANRPGVPHGEGDYLVCSAGADGEPDLSDVWVVNGVVFPDTYEFQ